MGRDISGILFLYVLETSWKYCIGLTGQEGFKMSSGIRHDMPSSQRPATRTMPGRAQDASRHELYSLLWMPAGSPSETICAEIVSLYLRYTRRVRCRFPYEQDCPAAKLHFSARLWNRTHGATYPIADFCILAVATGLLQPSPVVAHRYLAACLDVQCLLSRGCSLQ